MSFLPPFSSQINSFIFTIFIFKHFITLYSYQFFLQLLSSSTIVNFLVILSLFYRRSAVANSKAKELGLKALVYAAKIIAYAMHTTLSGLLMLAIMKYNVGVFLVLIIGNTIGWSIFSLLFGNAEVKQECH